MPQETGPKSAIAKDGAKIWLDVPAENENLALGFSHIAAGLARIIQESEPCFAIGIFGGWGSGKTTLMKAIKGKLPDSCVCVDFNAWRFEREPSLLVPLLDTIRGALAAWAKGASAGDDAKKRAAKAAGRMARVVRGLATGLSAEVGVPGAVKIGYDLDKGMKAMRANRDDDKPQSLYVAAFEELTQSIGEMTASRTRADQLSQPVQSDNAIRVVVFVDDLDRCLPDNALEVLEAMKLFFDIPGFVFVAGLDEHVVRQAVGVRLRRLHESSDTISGPRADNDSARAAAMAERERDYLDKIFQIPYRLPQATTNELNKLLTSIYQKASPEVRREQPLMEKYLGHVSVNGRINPRTVKRFLNSYILQMLTHDKPSAAGRGEQFKPHIVLALLVLWFRYEWLYDEILIDWRLFQAVLRQFQGGDRSAFEDISRGLEVLPADLGRYLGSDEAKSLAGNDDLEPYLSSMDAAGAGITGLIEPYRSLTELRHEVRQFLGIPLPQDSDRDKLIRIASECGSGISSYPEPGDSFVNVMRQLAEKIRELQDITPSTIQSGETVEDKLKDTAEAIYKISDEIRGELGAIRGSLAPAPTPVPPAPTPVAPEPTQVPPEPAPAHDTERQSYYASAMETVQAALPEGWRLEQKINIPGSGFRFDGLIESDARKIVVETFYSRSFSGGEFFRAIRDALRIEARRIDAVLIIARSPNAPGFERLEGDLTHLGLPHKVLEWLPHQKDDKVLRDAVRNLIQDLDR
jgi:KAP family P-loop domain